MRLVENPPDLIAAYPEWYAKVEASRTDTMHVLTGRLGKLPQKDGRVPHSVRSDLRRRLDRAVLMPRARKRKRARRSHRRPRATSGDTLSMVDAEATRMTDAPARCGRVLESGEKGCEDGGHSLNAGEPDEAVSEASGEDGHRGRDRGGSDRVVPAVDVARGRDVMRWHLSSIEAMARPPAERSADWFERQKHALLGRSAPVPGSGE